MRKSFRTTDGTTHSIDAAGNHFIGAKCQNPLASSGQPIGSTIPKDAVYLPEVTGKVPYKIGAEGQFIRL